MLAGSQGRREVALAKPWGGCQHLSRARQGGARPHRPAADWATRGRETETPTRGRQLLKPLEEGKSPTG